MMATGGDYSGGMFCYLQELYNIPFGVERKIVRWRSASNKTVIASIIELLKLEATTRGENKGRQ